MHSYKYGRASRPCGIATEYQSLKKGQGRRLCSPLAKSVARHCAGPGAINGDVSGRPCLGAAALATRVTGNFVKNIRQRATIAGRHAPSNLTAVPNDQTAEHRNGRTETARLTAQWGSLIGFDLILSIVDTELRLQLGDKGRRAVPIERNIDASAVDRVDAQRVRPSRGRDRKHL